jgi:hypothetical protein
VRPRAVWTRWRRKKSIGLPGIKARFLGPQLSHLADYAALAATSCVRCEEVFYISECRNVIHTTFLSLVLIDFFYKASTAF